MLGEGQRKTTVARTSSLSGPEQNTRGALGIARSALDHGGPVVDLRQTSTGDSAGVRGGRHYPNLCQLCLPQELREPAQVADLGWKQQRAPHSLASHRI